MKPQIFVFMSTRPEVILSGAPFSTHLSFRALGFGFAAAVRPD